AAGQPLTIAVPRDAAAEPWVVGFDGPAQEC
ncbi:MAG: hypothetical protein QOF76_2966, partial [Solirubrobacteraceae bacterium]|nr:hypothetical protein [Solirubrobacteraceae bacterium]